MQQRREQPPGLPHHREPLGERFDEMRDDLGGLGRQHAFHPGRRASQPLRMAGEREQHEQARHRGTGRHAAPEFHVRELAGFAGEGARRQP